jgi:DNA integrity scanning protein DisA with diadenylate cyclase activity
MASPEVEKIIELNKDLGSFIVSIDDFDAVVKALRIAEEGLRQYRIGKLAAIERESKLRTARVATLRREQS